MDEYGLISGLKKLLGKPKVVIPKKKKETKPGKLDDDANKRVKDRNKKLKKQLDEL